MFAWLPDESKSQGLRRRRAGIHLLLATVGLIFVVQSYHLFHYTSRPVYKVEWPFVGNDTSSHAANSQPLVVSEGSSNYFKLPKKVAVKQWNGPANVPSAVAYGESFASFLKTRLGPPDPMRPVWLVEADSRYLKKAVPHLQLFLARMEEEDLPLPLEKIHSEGVWADQVRTELKPGMAGTGRQELVILCLDSECPNLCEEERLLCYGGHFHDMKDAGKPSNIAPFVWTKLRALIEMTEAGYPLLWADGDVYFKSNPFIFMKEMSDPSWDIQVTDEEFDNGTNIGFFLQRGTKQVASVWKRVLERLVKGDGWWDQLIFNDVLNIGPLRIPDKTGERRKADIVSADGIKVHILDKERFRGYMLGYLVPPEAVFIHMPCADNSAYKDYVAATYGYFQDANDYYSKPPKLLTTPLLSGSEEEVIHWMRLLLAASKATGRAIVPPMEGAVHIEGETRYRHFSSIFPVDDLRKEFNLTILEPGYNLHAAEYLLHNPPLLQNMTQILDLDLRNDLFSFDSFLERLQSPIYRDAQLVSISHGVEKSGYRNWELPNASNYLQTCENLARGPSCTHLCDRKEKPSEHATSRARKQTLASGSNFRRAYGHLL